MNKKNANSKNAFVTIVGRANAGKSSLLNALVGEKIAAVSDKPQTTRTKITGVLTKGETQFVFMDTPGMHKAKNKLSEHMLNAVNESVAGVDLIILMADCTKKISENGLWAFPAVIAAQLVGRASFLGLVAVFQLRTPFNVSLIWSQIQTGVTGLLAQGILVPVIIIGLRQLLIKESKND